MNVPVQLTDTAGHRHHGEQARPSILSFKTSFAALRAGVYLPALNQHSLDLSTEVTFGSNNTTTKAELTVEKTSTTNGTAIPQSNCNSNVNKPSVSYPKNN